MAKLYLGWTLATLLILTVYANEPQKHLHAGRTKALISKKQAEFRETILTVKDLNITSNRDKIELSAMLNDVVTDYYKCLYFINQAVPHVKNVEYKRKLEETLLDVEDILHETRSTCFKDPTKAQEKLEKLLVHHEKVLGKFLPIITEHHADGETFISYQLRVASDTYSWSLTKLYLQAKHFTKTNKELESLLDAGALTFENAFKKIKLDDEETRDEAAHLIRLLVRLTGDVVTKLEFWMAINKKEEGAKIVEETANALVVLYDKLHRLTCSDVSAIEVSPEFTGIYHNGLAKIKQMAGVIVREELGGNEFIRSTLFDCLAVGHNFSEELEIFLANKNTRAFN